ARLPVTGDSSTAALVAAVRIDARDRRRGRSRFETGERGAHTGTGLGWGLDTVPGPANGDADRHESTRIGTRWRGSAHIGALRHTMCTSWLGGADRWRIAVIRTASPWCRWMTLPVDAHIGPGGRGPPMPAPRSRVR